MPLKVVVQTLDGLDEPVKALYKPEPDGRGFRLDVDGVVEKAKLEEFRSNNVALAEELKALKEQMASYAGIDPKKYKELLGKITNLEEKKLLDEGKIDELFQLRTDAMKHDFTEKLTAKERMLKALEEERDAARKERDQRIIDVELRRATDNPEFGFQPGVADLLRREVLDEFQYKEGKVVRVKPDGSIVYGKNSEPVTIDEFLDTVIKDRPYLVKPSSGGGARPGRTNSNGQKIMRRADWDMIQDPKQKMDFMKAGGRIED